MRLVVASALLFLCACSHQDRDDSWRALDRVHQDQRCAEPVGFYEPKGGVVSSASIGEAAAYAYLKAIYPNDNHLRPMTANLTNGVWTVSGTLPKGSVGGVATILLCQSNGRVLQIIHGK
jgi:hypothetical protein